MSAPGGIALKQLVLDLLEVEESAPTEMIHWYLRTVWKLRVPEKKLAKVLTDLLADAKLDYVTGEWRLCR